MAQPKAYMESCCFIEYAKGVLGRPIEADRVAEVEMCRLLLRAARAKEILIYTSTITIAEATHVGETPPPEDAKKLLSRLLMSGQDGVLLVEADPFVMEVARDLSWIYGIGGRLADRVHLASAMHVGCEELLSVDGKLARRVAQTTLRDCRVILPSASALLPDAYRAKDLFSGETHGTA
jgi:predicted nucleic acid-binding protein